MPLEKLEKIADRASFFALYENDEARKANNPKVIYAQIGLRTITACPGCVRGTRIEVGEKETRKIPRFYIVTQVQGSSLYGHDLRLVDGEYNKAAKWVGAPRVFRARKTYMEGHEPRIYDITKYHQLVVFKPKPRRITKTKESSGNLKNKKKVLEILKVRSV